MPVDKQLQIIDQIKTALVAKSNQIGVQTTVLNEDYIKAVDDYRNSTEENKAFTKNKLTEIMNEYPKRIEIKNRLIEATKAH
jgi:Cdc6-like AAA superfamily ATPase